MTISIWRYSHLALAVSSFLLLALASITGIILSFEPVSEKLHPYRADNFNQITLAQTLPVLRKSYPSISELTVDANQFVQIKASDTQGKNLVTYVDPRTGKALGAVTKQNEFFRWVTTLHRSLFLHETGRFFIGITAFLLFLISISGTLLVIQRQRGLKRFFTRVVKDNFAQYYHVVLGRLMLIPIIVIALTGTFLSLSRFGLVDSKTNSPKIDIDAIRSKPERKTADIDIFKNTKLADVQNIEFPFSEDPEDYYTIKLSNREVSVNQVTGDILSEVKYPTAVLVNKLSLNIHTGRASGVWAIILAVASANILFFIYSGFAITFKRRVKRIKNKYKAEESRFIILIGSANGNTFRFAMAVHQQLLKLGEKSFITELNNYTVYAKAQHLLVFTSTYGLGEAPVNAGKFTKLLEKHPQPNQVHYSVVGFGSHAYPDFCKFAFEVNHLLSLQGWAIPLVDIHTIANQSMQEFKLWAEAWSQQSGISITVFPELQNAKVNSLETFIVSSHTKALTADSTFLLRFQLKRMLNVTSGDLLAIYPANDHRERLYSIGMIENDIQLSVRLHHNGLGSGFLNELNVGQAVEACIIKNEHFYFPAKASQVIMISNGTGIAPFLGMIDQNSRKTSCHLYCGFRDNSSFAMYSSFLEESTSKQKLSQFQVALSREGEKQRVSKLIERDIDFVAKTLIGGGVIMICGSLHMQKDVIALIEGVCLANIGKSVSYYQSHNQILMDCY